MSSTPINYEVLSQSLCNHGSNSVELKFYLHIAIYLQRGTDYSALLEKRNVDSLTYGGEVQNAGFIWKLCNGWIGVFDLFFSRKFCTHCVSCRVSLSFL